MYTNAELLQATGITGRQLRTYRSRRLIDPPYPRTSRNERGEYPIWGEKHLKQIQDIQAIRRQNRTLEDIRKEMQEEEAKNNLDTVEKMREFMQKET